MKLKGMIKKADIILLIALLILGFASLLLIKGGTAGENAVITVDGKPYGTYPLAIDRVVEINTEYGYNQVTIQGGKVWISKSDCSNHDCEAFGSINTPMQSIMCLPHRLIVTVSGKSDIDVVLY